MKPLLILLTIPLAAQQPVNHEGRPGLELANDKVSVVILNTGGAFARFTLKSDPTKNPMWDPARIARERGGQNRSGPGTGHFLCVDGFGPSSPEEAKAGIPGHGEANKQEWKVTSSSATQIDYEINLPVAQERLVRKVSLAPGEQVVRVDNELESLVGFDRQVMWAEHATVGAPFLKLGKTVVDASTTRCRVKAYRASPGLNRTLPANVDFTWPQVVAGGQTIDLRVSPSSHEQMNHIGCLFDQTRDHAFITALDTEDKLLIGYLFKQADYPWVQHWMNYPGNGGYAWGIEFGVQPFDMTRRDVAALSPMFGAPTFAWLPAKSKLSKSFLMFVTKVPDGFRKVHDVSLGGGELVIEDRANNKKVTLKASKGL